MADNYTIEVCNLIKNLHGYTFYKLHIDGVCQFDEFLEEINMVKIARKKISDLFSRMGCFGDYLMPKKYFRHIKEVQHKDIFEFKKDDIRIYVKLEKPNVIIILGGYKGTQKKDIQKIKRIITQL